MNPKVDDYIKSGCGRCPLYNTQHCKVNSWRAELNVLRKILLKTELNEELKWKQPCYTLDGKNVLILSAFKEYAALNFFKGALMRDPLGILVQPTENTQADRQLRFTAVSDIEKTTSVIEDYINEAIEVEKTGQKIEYKKTTEFEIPEELQNAFDEDPQFKEAFNALTPGRQRGYLLYFSQPKQSQTRVSRIEKFTPKIFDGLGWNDR